MIIDNKKLDELSQMARSSSRLRASLDLRNTENDYSQRLLNAIEPGTKLDIHCHKDTSETVTCIRGHFTEHYFNEDGDVVQSIDMRPGVVINIPAGQWHNLESLESGTVLLSCKDGAYAPLKPEEIWEQKK
jgi:cupin fold WbuC family metalloprotein